MTATCEPTRGRMLGLGRRLLLASMLVALAAAAVPQRAAAAGIPAGVTFTVKADPAGHRPFVESGASMPGTLSVAVSGASVSITGTSPFVDVSGTLVDATAGDFMATGTGTVAGFPNVSVSFDGTFDAAGLRGTYTMGTGGGLPGGQAIAYNVAGMPLSFVVNSTDDAADGVCDTAGCSLRDAIAQANVVPGIDTITFALTGGTTIRPLAALPAIVAPLVIDGASQPGYAGTPLIELDGSLAGAVSGLSIQSAGNTVKGLLVNRFLRHAIELSGLGGGTFDANILGTDATGSLDLGNGGAGISLLGSGALSLSNSTIGYNAGGGLVVDAQSGAIDLTLRGNTFVQNGAVNVSANIDVGGTVVVGGPNSGDGNIFSGDLDVDASFDLGGPIQLTLDYTGNLHTVSGTGLRVTGDSNATVTLTTGQNTYTGGVFGADYALSGGATITSTGDTFDGQSTTALRVTATPISGADMRLTLDGASMLNAGTDGVELIAGGSGTLDFEFANLSITDSGRDCLSIRGSVAASLQAIARSGGGNTFSSCGSAGLTVDWSSADLPLRVNLGAGGTFRDNDVGYEATINVETTLDALGGLFGGSNRVLRRTVAATPNTFSGNSQAGIIIDGGTASFRDDTVTGNGTGIIVRNGGALTLDGVTVSDNTGDGVDVRDTSTATISNSTLTGNGGSDVNAASTSTVTLDNTTTGAGGAAPAAPGNVAPTPPPGGLTFVTAGTTSIQAFIDAQTFDVATLFLLDVSTQQFLRFVVGGPAIVNTLASLDASDVVVIRRK